MNYVLAKSLAFIKDRFRLGEDLERENKICQEIRDNTGFRGVEVWILVFAIFICSIGLNVNATAVVIGAMLISPLMGPIMGVGLGVGISDLNLIKRAGKNLTVMVVISVIASALYFLISPLQEAKSELLARTTPTIWDVFIAMFGGFAGIVATSSKQRGNVIPGVAIATALMPPLCTAGYGLAMGKLHYFAGAFYLFSINAVFIWLSTLVVVRLLRFKEIDFVSPAAKKRVRTMITVFVILMVLPSIFIARNLVVKSLYEERANLFIKKEFTFPETHVFRHTINFSPKKEIEVSLMGANLDENTIANLRSQLASYELEGAALIIKQGDKELDPEDLRSQLMKEFLTRDLDSLKNKDEKIAFLTKELVALKGQQIPIRQLSAEAVAFDKNIRHFTVQQAFIFDQQKNAMDTLHLAYVKYLTTPDKKEVTRLTEWLKVRIEADSLKMVVEGERVRE